MYNNYFELKINPVNPVLYKFSIYKNYWEFLKDC